MIFEFHDSLKSSGIRQKQALAHLVVKIMENNHFAVEGDMWQWLEVEVINRDYLGRFEIEEVHDNLGFRQPSGMMLRYLGHVIVGYGNGMAAPDMALKLAADPCWAVVENQTNDWALLERWIELMKNEKVFKWVNTYVENRRQGNLIRPRTGGGGGQIVNTLISLEKKDYKDFIGAKALAFVDSDRKSKGEALSNEKTKIINHCAAKGIPCHLTYKREAENYFNLDCFITAGYADGGLSYTGGIDDWDYVDVESFIKNNSCRKYDKSYLPTLCKYLDHKALTGITAHHPVLINGKLASEIQELILKFAKIV